MVLRDQRRVYGNTLLGVEGGIIGLEDTQRRLRQIGVQVAARMQAHLKLLAQPVADEAKKTWRSHGRVRSGDLVSSVRTGADKTGVYVAAGGVYKGAYVPYASMFEYTRGNRHPVFARGPRNTWTWAAQPHDPALNPAVTKFRPVIVEATARMTDRVIRQNNLNP
jgi:hypothetical protein